jgi:heme-degrading monooxygenase HmoA
MAYLLHHFWPGGTEDQYRATVKAVHPFDGLPEGQTFHAAGPTDGGFLITSVWDSQESADRFVQGTLLAKMPVEGGFEGRPEERAAEIVSLQPS